MTDRRVAAATRVLARLVIVPLLGVAACLASPASAQRSLADGLFRFPLDYTYADACDARYKLIRDPEFGRGLIARYFFHDPRKDRWRLDKLPDLSDDHIALTETVQDGKRLVVADDELVIRTHDDLVASYNTVCRRMHGVELFRVELRRATDGERRRVRSDYQYEVPPVAIGGADRDFLPVAVPNGVEIYEDGAKQYAKPWPVIVPEFGRGLSTIYLLEGRVTAFRGYSLDLVRNAGFIVVGADIEGKSMLIVIDPVVVTDRERQQVRAALVRPIMGDIAFALQRIVYYPARNRGIDDLRLPAELREAMRQQVAAVEALNRKDRLERSHRFPEFGEVATFLDKGWKEGLDIQFAAQGSIFGEINDMICKRDGEIFNCKIGVTYLLKGKPKYRQTDQKFARDAEGYALTIPLPPEDDIILRN